MNRVVIGMRFGVVMLSLVAVAPVAAEEVARVNNAAVTTEELQKKVAEAPESMKARLTSLDGRREVLDILIARELLFQEAQRLQLEKQPATQQRLDEARKNALIDMVMEKLSAERLTEDQLKTYYNAHPKDFREARASHILVAADADAQQIQQKLAGGADFTEIARGLTKDPGTGKSAGDLGYFTRERMVKEVADAAFSMKLNEVRGPIKTHYGIHFVKLTDLREPPTYDKLSPQLRDDLRRAVLKEEIARLRARNKVTVNEAVLKKAR